MAVPIIQSSTDISVISESTFNVNLPSGTIAGNLLLAIVAKDDDPAMTSAHGFTKGFGIQFVAGGNSTWAWWKIADSDDITRGYVTFGGDDEDYVGRMYRITGHNADNPIYAVDTTGATGTSDTPQAPSITVVLDCLTFAVTGMDDNDVPYSITTSGWTEELNTSVTTAGIVIGTRDANTAGATGAVDFLTNASDGWAASQIAVNGNVPPTVELNTADEYDFGADTTPTVEFTGTDDNNDDIEYNIQIDTVNTFDSQVTIMDSYSEANQSVDLKLNALLEDRSAVAQSFTGDGTLTSSFKLYLKKSGSPTGNATPVLYAHTGIYGSTSVPTGSALATAPVLDVSTLTTSYQLIEFTFSTPYQTVNGTKYCIALEYGNGDATNYVIVGGDDTSPTHDGNFSGYYNLIDWSPTSGTDLCFYIYGEGPLLDKDSSVPDATFTNTTDGGDTHPFDSGDKCDYTVQAGDALDDDTYYWRVRGLDPDGMDEYGAWTATRWFTVSAGVGDLTVDVFDNQPNTEDVTITNTQLGNIDVFDNQPTTEDIVIANNIGIIDIYDEITVSEDVTAERETPVEDIDINLSEIWGVVRT